MKLVCAAAKGGVARESRLTHRSPIKFEKIYLHEIIIWRLGVPEERSEADVDRDCRGNGEAET